MATTTADSATVGHRARRAVQRVAPIVRSTWFLGAVLFVITWPVGSLVPRPGLDNAFVAGLYMAAHAHLHFGTQLVGTYGPLGFLRYPVLYYTWPTRLAFLYTGGVHLALCLTLVWALRRLVPVLVAFLISWVAVAIIASAPESALVVIFVWLVEFLRRDSSPRLKSIFPALAGCVAGLEVLIKINTGITVAILAAIAIAVDRGRSRRRFAVFAGCFAATFLVAWFATGQTLGNIGSYVSTAREVIDGWSTAMQGSGLNYQPWGALVAAIAVAVVAWQSTRMERLSTRLSIIAIWLLLAFSVFKEGFVTEDIGHESIYFATALGALFAFTWRGVQRTSVLWALTLGIVIWVGVTQADPGHLLTPQVSARALAHEARTMLSASRREATVARARADLRAGYALDPATLAALQGHTVAVVPSEQEIAWAYGLRWLPMPVYQLYYALTPGLDNLNAKVLASPSGPQRLLRSLSPPVNRRNANLDSPAAQRAMLCHFVAVSTTASYQVLARVPDRCGRAQLIATVRAPWRQYVPIPAPHTPGDLVYVSVSGAEPHGLESLRALLWRSVVRAIDLRFAASATVSSFTIPPDIVADGMLMSVTPQADFPSPFSLSQLATALTMDVGSRTPPHSQLTYRFYEQPIATPAAP